MVGVASSQELVYNIQDLEVKEQTLEQDNTLVHKQATSGLTQMTADATDGRKKKGHKRGSKRKAVEDTLARWKMQNQLEVAANGAEEARKTRPRGSKKERMLGKGGPDKAVCGYRGARQRRWGKWVAEIREPTQKSSVSKGTKGKRLLLGTFDAAIETALAYDRAARAMYGSGAHRNFPEYSMESLNSPNKALHVVTNRKLEAASTSDRSEEHKVNHHSLLYAPGCSQSPVRGSMKNLDSYGVCADNGLKVESDCYEFFVNEELKEEPEDITGEPRGASIDFEVETSVFRKEIDRELEEIEKLCGWYGFSDMNNCLQSELENMGCESRIDCEPFW